MIISMKKGASPEQIEHVKTLIASFGYRIHESVGAERTLLGAIGDERGKERLTCLEAQPGVEKVIRILSPYKLVSRETKAEPTAVDLGMGVKVGNSRIAIMAGPCAVESREQIMEVAEAIKDSGAHVLRGGAFKPRTSPYAFQGLKNDGLLLLSMARERFRIPVVTEVMDIASIEVILENADCLQVGARNIQNFQLLKEVGRVEKPVLLKRGMSTTIDELLMSAEYVLSGGNSQVILCERGIRTFRDRHQEHPRPLGHTRAQGKDPPARHRGPVPRHRPRALRGGDVLRGHRGRGGRPHDRGPPETRGGPVRRAAVAEARRVQADHGGHQAHRRSRGKGCMKALIFELHVSTIALLWDIFFPSTDGR